MTNTLPTQERVDEVARGLAPDVVRIRFNIAPDWSDHPAMYFRVILSDDAVRRERLAGVADKVSESLTNELGLEEFDHIPYFRFRSQSEQEALQDKGWV